MHRQTHVTIHRCVITKLSLAPTNYFQTLFQEEQLDFPPSFLVINVGHHLSALFEILLKKHSVFQPPPPYNLPAAIDSNIF